MSLRAYKGFNKDLQCTPGGKVFQYAIGETYEKPVAELCKHGFHACEAPLDVWGYYPPVDGNRFCEVELDGVSDERSNDTKVTAKKITVGAELGIPGLVKAHVEWVKEHLDAEKEPSTNTGNRSAATNTGNWSAATNTGNRSAATNTGNWSAATNTGNSSAATNTGNWSAATNTGNWSAATNTGDRSAATNTGNRSAATNTGDSSAATNTGNRSAATVGGVGSVAIVTGYASKARGGLGCAIVVVERGEWDGKNYPLLNIKAALVDGETIKPDTWYTLKNGEFVEVIVEDA